jgi:ELWxxDGT repeat protein
MVKDIAAGSPSSSPANFTWVNGTVYFTARNGSTGNFHDEELWKTNGTEAGTVMVKDIRPGTLPSSPTSLINYKDTLYFNANDGVKGNELWKSDGTEAGTIMVKDIATTGSNGSFPANLIIMNDTLFFTASNGANGTELWRTDGSANGTVMVKDIYSGSSSASPRELTNVNGTLYFIANALGTGGELWKSNGSNAGTVMIKELIPGSGAPSMGRLMGVNGYLFFVADLSTIGFELWRTDGTDVGTISYDILEGPTSSNPGGLTPMGTILIFTATDLLHGAELWKFETMAAVDFTWTGTFSTAWENPGNWSGNVVPGANSAVVIPAGMPRYPVVNVNISVKSLSCAPGASVNVANGVLFQVLH